MSSLEGEPVEGWSVDAQVSWTARFSIPAESLDLHEPEGKWVV